MIETNKQLQVWLKQLKEQGESRCAVDLEADNFYHYQEKLCLIQFANQAHVEVIDPLSMDDLIPFIDYLDTQTVWMHGAQYDFTLMHRYWGRIPGKIYDTQIAAKLLGFKKLSLGEVLNNLLGESLDKTEQRSDWTKRPLPESMLEYAKGDVLHLLAAADILTAQLKELGRWEWFEQSCDWEQNKKGGISATDYKDKWRIKGSEKLKEEALCYLQAIGNWREERAAKDNKTPFKILGNAKMLEWAQALAKGEKIKLYERWRKEWVNGFNHAIKQAKKQSQDQWPPVMKNSRMRLNQEEEKLVKSWIETKRKKAAELNIQESTLGSRGSIEAWIKETQTIDDLFMPWQIQVLGMDKENPGQALPESEPKEKTLKPKAKKVTVTVKSILIKPDIQDVASENVLTAESTRKKA